MQRVHAFISGEVQGVGYREEVKRIAFDLNICGWIMNLEDGRVEIIAEGENRNIEEFLDRINIKKYPVFVENIMVEEEIFKGEFRSFKIIRDKDVQKELLSALSRGTVDIHEVKEILQTVKQDTSALLGKQDKMLEKQDKMLEKQDKMLEKQDKMLEKQDRSIELLETIKEDTSDMKSSLKDTKSSLSSFIEEKFKMQEMEITEIKATLARMQAAG